MNTYYFSFGFGHQDRNLGSLANCYTTVEAETEEEARRIMHERRGPVWAFSYDSAEEAGVERFNLRHIPLDLLTPPSP